MSVRNRLATGIKATLIGRIVRVGANGLLLLLLTRYLLDPTGYGLLMLGISVLTVFQLGSDLGLGKSAAKYITEYREGNEEQVRYILRESFKLRTGTILLTASLLVITAPFVAEFVGEPELRPLLYVGVFYLIGNSYRGFTTILFQGFNQVTWSAVIQITNNIARILFAVLFVSVFELGVLGALLGYITGAILSAILAFGILKTQFYEKYTATTTPETGLRRRILEYSVPLTLTRSAGLINGKIDSILIGVFLTPAAVGFYALGKQISSFALVPAGSLGFAVSPTYGEQKANEDLSRAARLYEQTLKYTLFLYLPAAAGLILVADPAIRLIFGGEYLGAVIVVQIFSAYLVMRAIVQITTDGLDFLGRARSRAIAKGSTAVANLGLNIVLIPVFGIAGAAAATVITTGVYTLVNLYIMHAELTLRLQELLRSICASSGIALGMGAVVLLCKPYLTGFIGLAGMVLIGLGTWAVLGLLIGPLDVRDFYRYLTENDPETQIEA